MRSTGYTCAEAAAKLGISRNTLLRWFREGRISGVPRDRRGWRSFSDADLERIRRELGAAEERDPCPAETQRRARMRAYLRRVPAFRPLPEPVLDELAVSARFQGLLAGQRLFSHGDATIGLPILVKGRVRLYRVAPDGREQTLAVVTPYQTLGETALFQPEGRHASYATCMEGSTVLVLPPARLRHLLREYPELSLRFLAAFSDRIEALEARVEEMALLSLEQRLARHLLDLSRGGERRSDGIEIELPMSTAELASLLGGARESLSRAFIRFRKEGLVHGQGRRLLLPEPEALERV